MILQSCSTSLVACNIYITSAASAALPSLLSRAQDHCRQLRLVQQQHIIRSDETKESNAAVAAIVHAYADIPYDRSSFHLAGRSDCVAEVAIQLIQNAVNEIELKKNDDNDPSKKLESRHPFVGLVDHVSIMPITIANQESGPTNPATSTATAAAAAAREIGSQIDQSNRIKVHYYGLACPNHTPLATVRRKTSFFRSGAHDSSHINNDEDQEQAAVEEFDKGECTIGAPLDFVENYNIRLTSNVDFSTAKTLTQELRGRNIATKGMGVVGVEALTLPYNRDVDEGGNVYEVACNLLEPKVGSVDKIEVELEKWIEKQKQQLVKNEDRDDRYNRDYFIDKAYRVGTTEEQCLSVLKNADEDGYWMQYDQQVYSRFNDFLGQR